MNINPILVYWYDPITNLANFERFEHNDIKGILEFQQQLRERGMTYISSCGDYGGADIVKDGKLPNGQPYTWKKGRRW